MTATSEVSLAVTVSLRSGIDQFEAAHLCFVRSVHDIFYWADDHGVFLPVHRCLLLVHRGVAGTTIFVFFVNFLSQQTSVDVETRLESLVLFLKSCVFLVSNHEFLPETHNFIVSDTQLILHVSDEQVLVELVNVGRVT